MYLDKIIHSHRSAAAHEQRNLDDLVEQVSSLPQTRGFERHLRQASTQHLAVIAEIKRKSPSKGDLFASLDPSVVAQQYESGGASCLSVLTDQQYFGGSVTDLQQARSATTLPVVRKDFTVSEFDVVDARLMGADCVLLIAAVLSANELKRFHDLATEIGLDVLIETHDESELDRVLGVGAILIGVNQRDLTTFEVDHQRAERMAALIPASAIRVAESGVRDEADARRLRNAGYDAVLVGESIVTSGDPEESVRKLLVS